MPASSDGPKKVEKADFNFSNYPDFLAPLARCGSQAAAAVTAASACGITSGNGKQQAAWAMG
jgi:hypothetical protein